MSEDKWLHLFTSNIRELYVADAVDLLAAPEGYVYQFRYHVEYVQEILRARWHGGRGGLKGEKVIIHFSLQHAANFHRAAYVPLRTGVVDDVFIEGKTYVIKFRVAGYAPLSDGDSKALDKSVHAYTDQLRAVLTPSYPDYPDDKNQRRSVAYSTLPSDHLLLQGDPGARFETVVSYMSAALEPQARVFFRVSKIWEMTRRSRREVKLENGYLNLTAGNEYVIDVSHFQTASRDTAVLKITPMSELELLSPSELPLRSRYDVMPIRLFAPFRDDEAQGQIVLAITGPVPGASSRLPVRIRPSHSHKFWSPFTAIVGAGLAVIPAAAGTGMDAASKVKLAVAGAVLLMISTVARRGKGLTALK